MKFRFAIFLQEDINFRRKKRKKRFVAQNNSNSLITISLTSRWLNSRKFNKYGIFAEIFQIENSTRMLLHERESEIKIQNSNKKTLIFMFSKIISCSVVEFNFKKRCRTVFIFLYFFLFLFSFLFYFLVLFLLFYICVRWYFLPNPFLSNSFFLFFLFLFSFYHNLELVAFVANCVRLFKFDILIIYHFLYFSLRVNFLNNFNN